MEGSSDLPTTQPTGTSSCNLHDTRKIDKPSVLQGVFSFVIDDVDGTLPELEGEPSIYYKTSTPAPPNQNKSEASRLQQIKGEAESRKNEFAKLLEEHAQVLKELKQMEDDPVQA